MQHDVDAAQPSVPIAIVGVNQIGKESDNDAITAGRDIPWLQDVSSEDAWGRWDAVYGDVFVLDGANALFALYNVEAHDLGEAANYDALMNMMLNAAAFEGN